MATVSTAHFRNSVLIEGVLSGLTITRLDTEKTAVLNSLNSHISNYNASETANQTARDDLQTQINDSTTAMTTAITDLTNVIDSNKTDIESKLAQETSDRLTLASEVSTRNTFIDGEIKTLNDLHTADSLRLTNVETALQNVDVNLQSQIDTAVNQLNINHSNVEPRTSKLEEFLIIDETTDPANPTVSIKPGVKFIVTGDFVQGN